jgi:hypothetical protein
MESNEYDFARNPVVQNEVFVPESKCGLMCDCMATD